MKKIIFLFVVLLSFDTFGSVTPSSKAHNADANRYAYVYYNDAILNINSVNVKMTQDDTYYYFNISQNVSRSSSRNDALQQDKDYYRNPNGFNIAFLGPEPYINTFYDNYLDSGMTSGFGEQYHRINGSNYWYCYDTISAGITSQYTTKTYYVKAFSNPYLTTSKNGLKKADGDSRSLEGPLITSFNSSFSGSNEYYNSKYCWTYVSGYINASIKIKKNEIDSFRYYMPLCSSFIYYSVLSKTDYFYAASLNYAIDLKNYTECDHNFVYTDEGTREYHVRYCDKCEWKKIEYHNFEYEYDEIENDMCACGCKKKVKINIHDNINKYNDYIVATPGDALYQMTFDKIGYTYLFIEDNELYYDKYNDEYQILNYKINNLPIYIPNNSHEYIITYNVHKYKINYMTENSFEFEFDKNMESQIISYDERANLSKSKYLVEGYTFVGWGIKPDIDTKIFDDEQEMYNFTDEDGYELNLYPIFDPYKYSVSFACSRAIDGYMPNQYFTYGIEENILGCKYKLDEDSAFSYWEYNGKEIKPSTSKSLEKYVKCQGDHLILDAKLYIYDRNHITEDKDKIKDKDDGKDKDMDKDKDKSDGADIDKNIRNDKDKTNNKDNVKTKDEEIEKNNKIEPVVDGGGSNIRSDNILDNIKSDNILDNIKNDDNNGINIGNDKNNINFSDFLSKIFGKNAILYGIIYAISIFVKMLFCISIVFLLIFLIFLLIISRLRIDEKRRKY